MGLTTLDQRADDEGLEELERHHLGQTTQVELESWTGHDDGAARVIDALTEQVLAKTPLLAFEHVGEALELAAAVGTRYRSFTPGVVVEQRIDGFLEHPLLVAADHFGST